MCWNITGSPPPAALKNVVPKKWSVSSIVTAPASTGITAISRYAVISQRPARTAASCSRSTPGARMFMMVTMTLIAPMIERAPIRWMAKIAIGNAVAGLQRQRRIQRPAAGRRAARHEQRAQQQRERERQDPEDEVVHARQRHVRRADLQRDHPVREADEGRHHRAEDHDQRVHGGHRVEELRIDELQAGLEQLGADHHRHRAADEEHDAARTPGTSCRCPCGWSRRPSGASLAPGRGGRDRRGRACRAVCSCAMS